MADQVMPATEAAVEKDATDERLSYELAYHVLPTVADGEVTNVTEEIKSLIHKHQGEIVSDEAAERMELAYPIVKHIENKNRSFSSSYFGWIRFKVVPSEVAELSAAMEARSDILRHLLIKLSKAEESSPFYFHEAIKSQKKSVVLDEEEMAALAKAAEEEMAEDKAKQPEAGTEEKVEVDEKEIDEALKKKEV